MESQYFIFDGIQSKEMNLHIVRIGSSGFVESPYWGGRDIDEELHKNKLTASHYSVSKEPIEFTVQLALMDRFNEPREWTPQERFKIADWLLHDTYKKLQTSDDLGKVYYAICTGVANLQLINTMGYLEITFRTNSPYAWSPIYIDRFDLSENETQQVIVLHNGSNVVERYMPKLEIEMKGSTEVRLKNLSNGGEEFIISNRATFEVISFDNENRIVKGSLNTNPFGDFNKNWLELVKGENRIEVIGKCILTTKSQYPIAQ